jgi:hypothetical protein
MEVRSRSANEIAVYTWASGQLDNLGDSLLRRPYLEYLRVYGALSVWARDADRDFLAGMDVDESEVTRGAFRDWYFAALRAAISRPVIVAVNAGEVPVSRRGSLRLLAFSLLIAAAKTRGGSGIWLGVGTPPSSSILKAPYRWVGKQSAFTWARDAPTLEVIPAAEVAPDWAFRLGTPTAKWRPVAERRYLALIMRGDRPAPSAEWMEWVRIQASKLGLGVITVSQVRRDDSRAVSLATALGGSPLLFGDLSHMEHELRVRELYANTRVAIGDRLHGLVVAATEGAVPFGWVTSSRGKIDRHFRTVGMDWVGEFEGAEVQALDLPLQHSEPLLRGKIELARQSIDGACSKATIALSETATRLKIRRESC